MITVQMTLDPKLVKKFDSVSKKLGMSRSALARLAFQDYLKKIEIQKKENAHKAGYANKPEATEFSIWSIEQVWDS